MNELTFLDLAILKKIEPDSSVEKFGSAINTSFFETANLIGTMKIKGYVNIEPSVGGMSNVKITEAGSGILLMAEKKAAEPVEPLDNALLHALAGGATTLDAVQNAVNVRSGDLAYHLNKLVAQGYMDFNIRSAKVYFQLTEAGFNATGGVKMQSAAPKGVPAQPDSSITTEQAAKIEPGGSTLREVISQPSAQPASAPATAPPWVQPAKQEKKDVAHLLSDAPAHAAQHAHKEHAHKAEKEKKPARALTPEEQKRLEQRRRMLSKMEYYIAEYGPWLILVFVVMLIFLGAAYLLLSKIKVA